MTDTTEAVERLRSATMPEYPIMPEVFIADVDAVCDALDQHQADRREQWALALEWAAVDMRRNKQSCGEELWWLARLASEIRSGKHEVTK